MQLSIGKNIQNKRKAMGLTQEQLATAIGVSVAAVSKWETGGAYPDITLLAPIARLLDVSVDHLLGFEPQLSKDEVMDLCGQCAKLFEATEYEKAVSFMEQNVREYPNSDFLKFRMGYVLMMHTPCAPSEKEAARLLSRAEALMREAAESGDIAVREGALQSLSALLTQQERYEEALEVLDGIHCSEIEPDQMRVSIYYAMGNYEKAKQTAQKLLAAHSFGCSIALDTLAKAAKQKKDYPLALRMVRLNLQLSEMFDRNRIYGQDLNPHLMIAQYYAEQKQERETLDALKDFLKCAQMPADPAAVKASPFFDSIELSQATPNKSYLNYCALEMVRQNSAFTFLSGNSEYQEILAALEQLPE
jgi:transcriptional regulator with XRE-family HTH domain